MSGNRVAKIEFDKKDEEEIIKKLKKAGFSIEQRRYNW